MGRRGETWVVVQAILLLLFLLVPGVGPAWPYPDAFRVAGAVLGAVGILLLAWSALNLGRSLTPFPRPLPNGRLVTSGAYRFVRHPIYFAVLATCTGIALATWSPLRLALCAALLVFFDRKASREEGWLQERYPGYAAYRERVSKLIPWIY